MSKAKPATMPDRAAREILLGFWKVHILHHAAERPIYGQWIAEELRRHGYSISPGTLYPLLKRMEGNGWLKTMPSAGSSAHTRKDYRLTKDGAIVLGFLRAQVTELYQEVVAESPGKPRRAPCSNPKTRAT